MLYKEDSIEDIIQALKINDVINKPFMLSNNDYEILKDINEKHKGINIIERSIYLYELLELSNPKILSVLRRNCYREDYTKYELMLFKDSIKKYNSKRFFTKVINFIRLKDEDDYSFYKNILDLINNPILVKKDDYNKVNELIQSGLGTTFLNSFAGQEIKDIDEIKAFCQNIYNFKIQNICIEYYNKISSITSSFTRVRTRRINEIQKAWNEARMKLKIENPNVLDIEKIKELDNIINKLK